MTRYQKKRNPKAKHKCSLSLHTSHSCYSQSERHHHRNQSCGVTPLLLLLPQLCTSADNTIAGTRCTSSNQSITGLKQQGPLHTDSSPLPSTWCPRYYTSLGIQMIAVTRLLNGNWFRHKHFSMFSSTSSLLCSSLVWAIFKIILKSHLEWSQLLDRNARQGQAKSHPCSWTEVSSLTGQTSHPTALELVEPVLSDTMLDFLFRVRNVFTFK